MGGLKFTYRLFNDKKMIAGLNNPHDLALMPIITPGFCLLIEVNGNEERGSFILSWLIRFTWIDAGKLGRIVAVA